MTAAALDRAFDVPFGGVLAVLNAADRAFEKVDRLEWVASFAPPVVAGGGCSCGSVFEARSTQIELDDTEKAAAADAIAELFGRASLDDLDPQIVARVVDVINHERACGDHDALMAWSDDHAHCGGDGW